MPDHQPSDALERGRESFERKAWGSAYHKLNEAARDAALCAEDLERLAFSARLLGNHPKCSEVLAPDDRQDQRQDDGENN